MPDSGALYKFAGVGKSSIPAEYDCAPMILNCPNCSARFMIDGTALGSGGRTVRCGACGHSWLQLPEPAAADQDAGPGPAPPPVPEEPSAAAPAPAPQTPEPAPALDIAKQRGRRRAEAQAAEAAAAQARRPRSGVSRILVWGLFVFVVAGIALGGYRYRQDVIEVWPPAIWLYQKLGLSVQAHGYGLYVPPETMRFQRETESGTPILVVSGEILNRSDKPQRVTPMRIEFLDKEFRVLRTERVKIEDRVIEPGKRIPFRTSIPNFPPEAGSARVTFDITGG